MRALTTQMGRATVLGCFISARPMSARASLNVTSETLKRCGCWCLVLLSTLSVMPIALAVEESPDVLQPLVLEFHYINGPRQEVHIAEGASFNLTTYTGQGKLRASGRVGHVVDGAVDINIETSWDLRDGGGGGSQFNGPLQLGQFRSGLASLPSPVALGSLWIRRGVDPVPTLVEALRRHDANASWAAYRLGELGSAAQAAVSELVEAVKLQDADVPTLKQHEADRLREYSAAALGKIGPAANAAVPVLLQQLEKQAGRLCVVAAVALWKISRHPEATPALLAALSESDGVGCLKALDALFEMGVEAPSAGPSLVAMLEESNPKICARAAAALWATTRDPRAVKALIATLKSDAAGYGHAAEALGRIGYPDAHTATEALAAHAFSDHAGARSYVAQALTRIDPDASQTVPAIVDILRQRDGQGVTEASEVLAYFGPIVLPQLRELLDSEDAHVRDLAFAALWKIGTPAVDTLAEALRHPRADVRRSAASRLRNAGGRKDFHALAAVPELVRALGDNDQQVRTQASFALQNVGPAAATAVKQALTDPNPRTRELAQRILNHVEPSADDP